MLVDKFHQNSHGSTDLALAGFVAANGALIADAQNVGEAGLGETGTLADGFEGFRAHVQRISSFRGTLSRGKQRSAYATPSAHPYFETEATDSPLPSEHTSASARFHQSAAKGRIENISFPKHLLGKPFIKTCVRTEHCDPARAVSVEFAHQFGDGFCVGHFILPYPVGHCPVADDTFIKRAIGPVNKETHERKFY